MVNASGMRISCTRSRVDCVTGLATPTLSDIRPSFIREHREHYGLSDVMTHDSLTFNGGVTQCHPVREWARIELANCQPVSD